jgi:hypothetical protein
LPEANPPQLDHLAANSSCIQQQLKNSSYRSVIRLYKQGYQLQNFRQLLLNTLLLMRRQKNCSEMQAPRISELVITGRNLSKIRVNYVGNTKRAPEHWAT